MRRASALCIAPGRTTKLAALSLAMTFLFGIHVPTAQAGFPQTIFLDYDTFTDTGADPDDHVYSAGERTIIADTLNDKFAEYPVTFTNTAPTSGLFSTVFFNAGLGSGDIDFQNKKMSDTATLHAPKLLEIAGVPIGTATSTEVVAASINIGAHESLHILGTRHHDAFLPIGTGVSPGTGGSDWVPDFPGPEGAFLTGKEFNSLTASLGLFSYSSLTDPDMFIGPRSAVKLLHDTFVDLDVDSTDANVIFAPQPLSFETIPIPNPLPPSDPFSGLEIFADVVIVEEASIEMLFDTGGTPLGPESDYYGIDAAAGDVITIEVISELGDGDPFDTVVALLDPTTGFSPVPWYTDGALNNDERESTDSLLLDVTIPADGSYVIEVFSSAGPDMFGDYEMLVYRFHAIPEPSTLVLAAFALPFIAALARRRRKR